MKYADLIDKIATASEVTKKDVASVLSSLVNVTTQSLIAGETVPITGLGTFKPGDRAARTGRNPATGAPLEIAAKKVASFKASTTLKDALN